MKSDSDAATLNQNITTLDRNTTTLNRNTAEEELRWAEAQNPGAWADHSRYVARACENIAARCSWLDKDYAYTLGLLHDIGRYRGRSSERHLIDGYRRCMEHGWEEAARICISHAFMIQDISTSIGEFDMPQEDYEFIKIFVEMVQYNDYDRLVQLCDSLALPSGFCLLEKRFVDVTQRYGVHPATVPRWNKIFGIKEYFEKRMGCPVYDLLPGVKENTFL